VNRRDQAAQVVRDQNPSEGEVGYPPPPPDGVLREAAYLIARGVRPLALLGTCGSADASIVRHRLLTLGQARCIPFVMPAADGAVAFGYASHAWAVDLLRWADQKAPEIQRDRILGLLLGYAPDAIRFFEEMGNGANP